jgi:molybdate transport system substrate-binding protein
MRMKIEFFCLLLLLPIYLISFGCGGKPNPDRAKSQIVVFAAASLTEAMEDISSRFEADHPGVHVVLNLAGSQQLAQQLVHGAQADVFASANRQQMAVVQADGRIDLEDQTIFAENRLVVVYSHDSNYSITKLADLAQPNLKIIVAAQDVPVGRYSFEFLDRAARDDSLGPIYRQAVIDNIVSYEDNVKFVLTKVALGEADAGIVYVTDIHGENGRDVGMIAIPDQLNPIAQYPIAVLNDSQQARIARSFIEFIISQEGRDILSLYGFAFPISAE